MPEPDALGSGTGSADVVPNGVYGLSSLQLRQPLSSEAQKSVMNALRLGFTSGAVEHGRALLDERTGAFARVVRREERAERLGFELARDAQIRFRAV